MSDVIRLACPQGWAFYKRRDKTDGCKKGRQYKPMPVGKQKPVAAKKPVARKPVRRTRVDQAAASAVGDKRADIEGFKEIMADSHRELSRQVAGENDALRNLLGQFGVNGKQIGGFLSKMRAAKDADAIKRFDEMVEMAERDYPELLEYERGGTAEDALFTRLQRGLRPMPKIHDDVVIQDAKDRAGMRPDGTFAPRSHRVDNSLLAAEFLSLNGWKVHRAVRLGWVADIKTKSKTGKWIGVGEHQGQVRYQKSKPGDRKHASKETATKKTAPEVRSTPELGSPDGGGDQRTDGRDEPKRLVTARAEFTSPANPDLVPESLREHLTEEQLFGAAKGIESLDNHGGFLLADGTGAGKSRQQLAIAEKYAREGKKVLLVTMPGVIRADWKTGEFGGSFRDDSEAMGINLNLYRGGELANGSIHLATYNYLARIKDHVDQDTVVIFDESHNIKNSSSGVGKHGHDVSEAAGKVMYATATPADRPADIAYLFRIIPDEQTLGSKRETKEQLTDKWNRVQALNARHSAVVEAIQQDASTGNVNAAVSLLMAHTAIRVGRARNEKEWGTFGAVTLEGRHVRQRPDGSVVVSFIGKKSIRNTVKINDPFLAKELLRRKERAGPKGKMFNTSYATVRKYLQKHKIHAHDLRRSVGTTLAAQLINAQPLPEDKNEQREFLNGVFDQVAARLGNTRYVARDAYIDPALLAMMPAHHPKSTKQRVKAELKRMAAGAKPGEMVKTISRWFDDITAAGLMVKREISMDGMSVGVSRMTLPDHAQAQLDEIDRKFATAYVKPGHAGLAEAQALMHKSRLIETFKVPHTVDMVRKSLASGKQVVIFAERVNESDIEIFTDAGKKEIIAQSEGTMKLLREHLQAAGIHDIAEIHGGVTNEYSRESQKRFQSGHARVVIASPGAAGTGINLDDRHGDRPRELIMMSPPLSAIQGTQVAGRIWRLKTKCPVKPCASIKYVLSNTQNDHWRWEINKNKMQSLGAIVEGELQTLVNVTDQMALNGRRLSHRIRVMLMAKRRKLADGWHEISGEGLAQPWLYYSGGKVTKRQKTKPKDVKGGEHSSKLSQKERSLLLADIGMGISTGRTNLDVEQAVMELLKVNSMAEIPLATRNSSDDTLRRVHKMVEDDRIAQKARANEPVQPKSESQPKAKEPWMMTKGEHAAEESSLSRKLGTLNDKVNVIRSESVKKWQDATRGLSDTELDTKRDELVAMRGKYDKQIEVLTNQMQPLWDRQKQIAHPQNTVLDLENTHKRHVESAIESGKPVPSEVLNEYPDLKEKYGKKETERAKAKPKDSNGASGDKAAGKAVGAQVTAVTPDGYGPTSEAEPKDKESWERTRADARRAVMDNYAKESQRSNQFRKGLEKHFRWYTLADGTKIRISKGIANDLKDDRRLRLIDERNESAMRQAVKEGKPVSQEALDSYQSLQQPRPVPKIAEDDRSAKLGKVRDAEDQIRDFLKKKGQSVPEGVAPFQALFNMKRPGDEGRRLLGAYSAAKKAAKNITSVSPAAPEDIAKVASQKGLLGKDYAPGKFSKDELKDLTGATDAPKPKSKQKAMFDTGKNDLPGQELLFDTDAPPLYGKGTPEKKAEAPKDVYGNKRRTDDEARKIRILRGTTDEAIDKYIPEKAVEKLGKRWSFNSVSGSHHSMYDTKKEALAAAKSHHELVAKIHADPSGYADLTSYRADRVGTVAKKYEDKGMGEHEAYARAKQDVAKLLGEEVPPLEYLGKKSLSLRPRLFTPCTLADLNGPTRMATDWRYSGKVIMLGERPTLSKTGG